MADEVIDSVCDMPMDENQRLAQAAVTSTISLLVTEGERMKSMAVMAAGGVETNALVGIIAHLATYSCRRAACATFQSVVFALIHAGDRWPGR